VDSVFVRRVRWKRYYLEFIEPHAVRGSCCAKYASTQVAGQAWLARQRSMARQTDVRTGSFVARTQERERRREISAKPFPREPAWTIIFATRHNNPRSVKFFPDPTLRRSNEAKAEFARSCDRMRPDRSADCSTNTMAVRNKDA